MRHIKPFFTDETVPLLVLGYAATVTTCLAILTILRGNWREPAFWLGALSMTAALNIAISRPSRS